MTLIQVKLIERVLDDGREQQIIERLADSIASIEGDSLRPVTRVVIKEE